MLLIIEGVDLVGKSSLAQRIADKIDAEVRHASAPVRHPIEEYETSLDGYSPLDGKHLVLDRHHLGEHVWPEIFGRESKMDKPTKIHLEMFMRSRGAFYIHGVRDEEKLCHELVERNEPLTPEMLPRALELFYRAFKLVGSHGTWDYERHGESSVVNFIWNAASYTQSVLDVWETCGPGWVGNPRPVVLLVGDELGPLKSNTAPPDDVPFAPYATTSGHYLMRSIKPFWRDVAIINAYSGRRKGFRNMRKVWKVFGKPSVVALGKNAARRLDEFEVPHEVVPHPQYWRRFRYNDRKEYTHMIEEAAF